jgi:prevent-host-death family protein
MSCRSCEDSVQIGGGVSRAAEVLVHDGTTMYDSVMSTMSVSEARAALPEILDRVLAGEEVTITRHGRAVAVVVRPDALRVRRADQVLADAERLRDLLDRSRTTRLSDAPELSPERAEELVARVGASRSAR